MAVTREQADKWREAERRSQKQADELVRYGEGAACFAEFAAWQAGQKPKRKGLTTASASETIEPTEGQGDI